MWTRHKGTGHQSHDRGRLRVSQNHLVWTDPWVYVALPDQEIEYFQMHEPNDEPRPDGRWVLRMTRAWRLLKALTIL